MRAAVVTEFGPILSHKLGSLPDPAPGAGEVPRLLKGEAL